MEGRDQTWRSVERSHFRGDCTAATTCDIAVAGISRRGEAEDLISPIKPEPLISSLAIHCPLLPYTGEDFFLRTPNFLIAKNSSLSWVMWITWVHVWVSACSMCFHAAKVWSIKAQEWLISLFMFLSIWMETPPLIFVTFPPSLWWDKEKIKELKSSEERWEP